MNKTKIILITCIIILLALGVLYGVRVSVQSPQGPEITVGDEITSIDTLYISETGDEARVTYYSNNTATLTIIGSKYSNIQFTRTESTTEVRYQNAEQSLELLAQEPELVVYKNSEELFSGKKQEVLAGDRIVALLPSTTWVWVKTLDGTGPAAQDEPIITPVQTKAFTLKFAADGTVSGTTDCNSFGGTYSFDERNNIRFGSFMSTLMYCENSQEQEFISMIKDSSVYITEEELILENDQTIYFEKEVE
jgi:heat shock protein HslJ